MSEAASRRQGCTSLSLTPPSFGSSFSPRDGVSAARGRGGQQRTGITSLSLTLTLSPRERELRTPAEPRLVCPSPHRVLDHCCARETASPQPEGEGENNEWGCIGLSLTLTLS